MVKVQMVWFPPNSSMGRSNLGSNQGNEKPIRPVPNHTKTGLLMRQTYVPPSKWPKKTQEKPHIQLQVVHTSTTYYI